MRRPRVPDERGAQEDRVRRVRVFPGVRYCRAGAGFGVVLRARVAVAVVERDGFEPGVDGAALETLHMLVFLCCFWLIKNRIPHENNFLQFK